MSRSIKANPTVFFTVIVNPSSGPGPSLLPDSAFQTGVASLRAAGSNSLVVGYIATGYGSKGANEVEGEIARYAGWPTTARLDGIFFDEAPNSADKLSIYQLYSDSVRAKSWVKDAGFVVRAFLDRPLKQLSAGRC